jgi:hypothetical protein
MEDGMNETQSQERLVAMLRRLLDDLERHQDDYHHVTPPGLVDEARTLLREFDAANDPQPLFKERDRPPTRRRNP